ncbi:MAG: Inositol 2-dehydrogenase/D-chiro-inositol 3-dehydrogenase [bacterium]|nr:Inositol 2-dehydrogenase/D-chiro-inositol 3-dehydrogenase [bacterium]
MNRREFSTQVAAGLSLLGTQGATAEQAPSRAPSPIRCAQIGLDHGHSLDVLPILRKSPDWEVVGICEPDQAHRETFGKSERLRGVRRLTEEEILRDDSIRMVAVETRADRVLRFGRAAIEAGKHVHLDKPPGTSLPEFKELLNAAEQRGLIVQLGYMFRYNAGFDLVRRAVGEGWLGDVYAIHSSMCTDLTPEKRERIASYPGGILLELGCHLIDMIVLLLGGPNKVSSFTKHSGDFEDGLIDSGVAVLEYSHALVSVEVSAMERNAFRTRRFKVLGTQGSALLEPLEPPGARLSLKFPAGGLESGTHEIEVPEHERHVRDFEELARCIRGQGEFPYSKEHDYLAQRTALWAAGVDVTAP